MKHSLLYKYIDVEMYYDNYGYYWNNIFLGKDKENAFRDLKNFKSFFLQKKIVSKKDIYYTNFFSKNNIQTLFKQVHNKVNIKCNENLTVIGYYCDDSLRTRLSYEKACHILGINYISILGEKQKIIVDRGSPYIRNESDKDIILSICTFSELFIARHPSIFFPYFVDWICFENNISTPFINAGAGDYDHPTQAISDLYLTSKYFNEDSKVKICFYGDCKNVRIIRSLSYLFSIYYSAHIIFLTPLGSVPTNDILDIIRSNNASFEIISNKNENETILLNSDIIYLTRHIEGYVLNNTIMKKLNTHTLVMHPLPKDGEISASLTPYKFSSLKYIEQMEVSKYVKATLMKSLISNG